MTRENWCIRDSGMLTGIKSYILNPSSNLVSITGLIMVDIIDIRVSYLVGDNRDFIPLQRLNICYKTLSTSTLVGVT